MKNNGPKFIWTFERHSLCRDLRRNAWLVLLAGCIAFMGIYIAQRSAYSPVYTSSATLAVRVKGNASAVIDNLSASADTAEIYAAVFQGASMKALAAENLGMREFPGDVSATVVSGINLMQLSVTADDPELAYRLLTSILAVYPRISDAIFSNAVIDMMEPPQMPDAPSNRLSMQYCLLLILLAVAAQTGIIVLLSLLRETVKHEQAFDSMIEGKLLGTITHERPHVPTGKRLFHKKEALLIDSAFSSLRFSEDYQKLATRLEYLKKNRSAAVFAITSVAENEGKSTVTVNLALALSGRGYRVAVLDLDLRKPSLYRIVGCQVALDHEFSDVLSGEIPVQKYRFLQCKPGVFFALNRQYRRDAAEWLDSDRMEAMLSDIRAGVDFVLVDTPPTSASADAAGLVRIADCAILVVRTDRTAVADINDTIATLSGIGRGSVVCVLNDVYRPFTLWGQMGADYDPRRAGKRYGGYRAVDPVESFCGKAAWDEQRRMDGAGV